MSAARHGWAAALLLLAPSAVTAACPEGRDPVGRIVALSGGVTLDGATLDVIELPREVCAESVVATRLQSRARIYVIAADTVLTLDEHSTARLVAPPGPDSGFVSLLRGGLYFLSQVRRSLSIETPYVSAGVEGTEVLMRVTEAGAELIAYDGTVSLAPGTEGTPLAVATPRLTTGERLAVDPTGAGAVERLAAADAPHAPLRRAAARQLTWTLFYPPIVADDGTARPSDSLRAARLLRVGRVEEARAVLGRIADGAPEAAERDALLALIAVVQGDPAEGRRLAEAAIDRAPTAAAPLLALSYAVQAQAEIEAAREAARRATVAEADNALAWARLAETELMLGETRRAREASARAVALAPTALALVVDGFAALSAFDAFAAERSFGLALALDSEQPLAHLGRGLAIIRQGRLEEGRQELEVAAGLDPTRSLLRSYLGKAYFEERRDAVAGTQFAIAKELDPSDPTPWLYDATRLDLDNRPVEALRNIERSIELNDNRATFRSRLLLDGDRASRTASLGRIYRDLGFGRLGRNAATGALDIDPANSGAHRLLGDLYAGNPDLEVARVSEQLQTQLLQDIGLNPAQPSLAFADLDLPHLSGFGAPSFGEYSSLFEREGSLIGATGVVGNESTLGNELSVNGLLGRAAVSLGQFHYQTDGFRENADLRHDILTAFGQVAVTEDLSLQAEFRYRDSDLGDRRLLFDPDVFAPNERRDIDEQVLRLGGRLRLAPGSDVILSLIAADRDEKVTDSEVLPSPGGDVLTSTEQKGESDGLSGELAWLGRGERLSLVLGGGLYHVNSRLESTSDSDPCVFIACPLNETQHGDSDGGSVFSYATLQPTETLDLTFGIGVAWFDGQGLDETVPTPKLGVRWRPMDGVTVRATALQALRRPVTVNQTIEPTQVAGFVQLYDDLNATKSDLLGLGLDLAPRPGLDLGADAVYRQSSPPIDDKKRHDTDILLRSYAYFTLTDELVLTLEPEFAQYKRAKRDVLVSPRSINTTLLPARLRYFHPSGLFAEGAVSYLYQDVARLGPQPGDLEDSEGQAGSVIVDTAVGYRLPGRYGAVRLELLNVLDERIMFQDDAFRTAEQVRAITFAPDRTVLLRLSLNW